MKMDYLLLLFVIVVFSQLSLTISSHLHPRLNNATDQHALLQFKANDPYNSLHDWTPNISFCHWTGVSCSQRRQRAIALNLTGMALQGAIPPFIGNLSFLRSIDLSNNTLEGHIPQQIGRLFRLRTLWLQDNRLECPIPNTLGGCRNLVELSLRDNRLNGRIPAELGTLTRLKFVEVGRNRLTGTIPSSLSNISSLTYLSLLTNSLVGFIPKQLGLLAGLEELYLDENNFIQRIPASLSNCKHLRILSLSENHLSGEIPSEFGAKLVGLQELYLWGNQLSGNIPMSLSNCSKLKILYLQQNHLTGMVPTELGKLLLLERLDLHSNQLISSTTLPFITALTNCSVLQRIDLANNQLSGMLPLSIALLSPKLSYLSLTNNSIRGKIPAQIGNLTNLNFLALDDNLFGGRIPLAFTKLRKLERLHLKVNRLEGSIPDEIDQMESLGELFINHNMFSGRIPDSLCQLQQLRRLHFSHNQFSGNIPKSLGKCQILELLDLSHNKLSGSIPPEVAGLPNLLFYMNLSWNSLQGSLPQEISKIAMVQAIDISGNHLTGIIPNALGSCIALEYLNVSHNALQGPIPATLVKLLNLEEMDFSYNFLSGTVSNSLKKLKMLRYVDFSFNNLTGEIPEEGVFVNRSTTALFKGNLGLCGPRMYSLHACPKHKSYSLSKIVLYVVCGSSVVLCGLFCVFASRFSVRLRRRRRQYLSYVGGHPKISYQELVTATNAFDEACLLGMGSFGSVYKGILTDGTVVAIKVLNQENEEAYNSFNTECEVLRRIRHKNVVRIITTCSNHHFRALILQFMSNGNLGKHLYRDGDRHERSFWNICQLSLRERVDIALDVAHGLAYLHHDCFVQVVHCDLKPSNILLDSDMRALLTDFSIAQLMDAEAISASIPPIRGSFGYAAPEYGWGRMPSTRGDVYSFGIVLLEMMTRRRPTDDMFMDDLTLQNWVRTVFPDRVMDVLDFSLQYYPNNNGMSADEISIHCLELVRVALLCTQEFPEQRPNMKDVVAALQGIKYNAFGQSCTSILPLYTELLPTSLHAEV